MPLAGSFPHPRVPTLRRSDGKLRREDTLLRSQHDINVDYSALPLSPLAPTLPSLSPIRRLDPRPTDTRVPARRVCVRTCDAHVHACVYIGLFTGIGTTARLFLPYARYVLPSCLASKSETGIGR